MTHQALHERLKPDETAEGQAFAAARRKDPAANQNAQSIVIHSLHRPGAPGIDRPGPDGRRSARRTPDRPGTRPRRTDNETRSTIGCAAAARRRVAAAAGLLRLRPDAGEADDRRARGAGPARRGQGRDAPDVKFVDITKEAGIHFVHYNGASARSSCPRPWAPASPSSTTTATATRTSSSSTRPTGPGHEVKPAPTQALYRNDGKGHFEDVTKAAGLDKTFYGQGVAVGDYDNDGDPDLYVTAIGGGHLFRNDGKGHFEDVTDAANASGPNGWLTGAAFLDIENDGDLDLFICNYITWTPEIDKVQGFQLTGLGRAYGPPTSFSGSFCSLLRNDGGRFTDISESSGVQVRTPDLKVPIGKSLGVAPYDVDGDGLVDIAVANDTVQNFLFHNKGGGQVRGDRDPLGRGLRPVGLAPRRHGHRLGPFLNDERLGLAVGNFANEMTALYVCDQPASLQFSDLANLYGLGAPTQPPLKFGLFFFDYDLDGRLDLLSANGHLEPEISKVQASETYEQPVQLFWNIGQAGPVALSSWSARAGRPRPVQADRRPRQRLCRHRRRRRPRRRHHRQQRPGPPLPQRRRQQEPLDPPGPRRQRQDLEPRRDRRQGRAQGRRDRLPPPALPGQELPLVGRAPADLRPGQGRPGRRAHDHLAIGQGHDTQGPQGRPGPSDRRGCRLP